MNHIKTFERIIYGDAKHKVIGYCANSDNFPELENVKNIFEDLSDWYYLDGLPRPKMIYKLYRIKDYGGMATNIFDIKDDTAMVSKTNKHLMSFIYYKSFRVNLIKYDFDNKIFHEKINLTIKRLINYGFHVEKTPAPNGINIYVIDKGDSITIKEILKQ